MHWYFTKSFICNLSYPTHDNNSNWQFLKLKWYDVISSVKMKYVTLKMVLHPTKWEFSFSYYKMSAFHYSIKQLHQIISWNKLVMPLVLVIINVQSQSSIWMIQTFDSPNDYFGKLQVESIMWTFIINYHHLVLNQTIFKSHFSTFSHCNQCWAFYNNYDNSHRLIFCHH